MSHVLLDYESVELYCILLFRQRCSLQRVHIVLRAFPTLVVRSPSGGSVDVRGGGRVRCLRPLLARSPAPALASAAAGFGRLRMPCCLVSCLVPKSTP